MMPPRLPRELGRLPRRVAGACIKPQIRGAGREGADGAVGRGYLRPAPYTRQPGVLVPGMAVTPPSLSLPAVHLPDGPRGGGESPVGEALFLL